MVVTHLYALIPLLVLLIMSMIWHGRGLLHVLALAYIMALAWMAVTNGWEIIFFPLLAVSAVIEIILVVVTLFKGDWL